ncbi:hypothetical protein psal_cds_178 [Pandoravirus salinus]|uniref:Uncharacterized protein n=1 Tax=Pandoravirus salinus TaxID=1349410 RepID=S4W010_9VIRU|nr:hypothetical protein psal_cds_178 [Pandoravirus salinus]AGO83672.1 hypothetical protein psal_cds_178 [Pandoravirus salinus]
MPKQKKKEHHGRDRRRGARSHSDSDIRAGPWTDSSDGAAASEDEAARGFIDDVTADLARVNPTNGICMGLPWETPLAVSATKATPHHRRSRSKKGAEPKKSRKPDDDDDDRRRRRRDNNKDTKREDKDNKKSRKCGDDDGHKEDDDKRKRAHDACRGTKAAATDALRQWSGKFEAEGRDAERVFAAVGTVEAGDWHRRYRAWLVEWGVASGDCRRVLRKGRSKEMVVTLRGLRGAHAARDAGADALRSLLTGTTPAQRRDPNWVRLHHFGGAYVSLTRDLDLWIGGLEISAAASAAQ